LKERHLPQHGFADAAWFDLKFKQRFSGKFHFRAKRKPAVVLVAYNSPEVEGFSISDDLRIAATSAETRTPDSTVHPTAYSPEPVRGIPPVSPANAAHGTENGPIRRRYCSMP
jgi:hypothetical protein